MHVNCCSSEKELQMGLFAKSIPAGGKVRIVFTPTNQGGAVAVPAFAPGPVPSTPAPNTLYVWATVHNQPAAIYAGVSIAADPDTQNGVLVTNSAPPANATVIDIKASYFGSTGAVVTDADSINLTLLADVGAAKTLVVLDVSDPF
jgi:hypothetical protein